MSGTHQLCSSSLSDVVFDRCAGTPPAAARNTDRRTRWSQRRPRGFKQAIPQTPSPTGHSASWEPKRRRTALPQLNPRVSWAWLDLNQRPHPYQLNAGNRCAHRPFPRSRPTVRAKGMSSIRPLVCVPPKSVRTSGAALLIASGSLILLCTTVHLYVSLLHHLGILVTQTTHPMLDALELRLARCSASSARWLAR
jgi:hypothetical protein